MICKKCIICILHQKSIFEGKFLTFLPRKPFISQDILICSKKSICPKISLQGLVKGHEEAHSPLRSPFELSNRLLGVAFLRSPAAAAAASKRPPLGAHARRGKPAKQRPSLQSLDRLPLGRRLLQRSRRSGGGHRYLTIERAAA